MNLHNNLHMRHVLGIKDVQPFTLALKFSTNEVLEINLEDRIKTKPSLNKSTYIKLLESGYFEKVKLNKVM